MIVEPVNRWQPVTNEYQRELAPFAVMPSLGKRDVEKFTEARRRAGAKNSVPHGIACIAWFYFLDGCACLLFASTLISHPESSLAVWLAHQSRILIPFSLGASSGIAHTDLLAEAFLIMAIVSVAIGAMWLVRYGRIRWITMVYAGAWLVRAAFDFMSDRDAGVAAQLSTQQKEALALSLVLNLLVFSYLAFFPGAARALEKPI